jgi:hypothetical protein
MVILLNGCKPNPLEDCFLSTGPIEEREFQLQDYPSRIEVFDNINVKWHMSLKSYIKIRCGRNIFDKIDFQVSENTLKLKNRARCNWVRDYSKEINIELFCPDPSYLELNGFGNFSCADTFRSKNIIIRQYGPGKTELLLKSGYIHIGFDTYGELKAEGDAQEAYFFTLRGGKLNTENLKVKNLLVQTESQVDLKVWATDSLFGEIRNSGKIYYKGNPRLNVKRAKGGLLLPF